MADPRKAGLAYRVPERSDSAKARASPRPPEASPRRIRYRRGVGIVLLNARSEVFVGCRTDVPDAWQMPQGGIDTDEDPRLAALRELKEEIGTDDVEILAESRRWLRYPVPAEFADRKWGGRWQGQRQKWFVMLFRGQDSEINIATEHPEFGDWRWIRVEELVPLAVSFKKQLYSDVVGEFATIFRD